MKVKSVAAPLVVLSLLQLQLSSVKADYQLEVTAHRFSNPDGICSRGNCCDSFGPPPCFGNCETYFTFCLRNVGTAQDSNPLNCPLGSFNPPNVWDANDVTFLPSFVPPFSGRSWPGGFQMLVVAQDRDPFGTDDHIDDIYIEETLSSGESLPRKTYSGTFRVATISLSFSLSCTSSMVGPNCTDTPCPRLTSPANGDIEQPVTSVEGSVATYSCNRGYTLVGVSTRTCRSGRWSRVAPVCELGCGRLTNPVNGRVEFNDTTEGSVAIYSCNTNFVLQGSETRVCLLSGWSRSPPTCIRECDQLTDPINGRVQFPSTPLEGARAGYTCDEGYILRGMATRTCLSSGWSGVLPTCEEPNDCGPLTNPVNGRVDAPNTIEPSVVTYSCNPGYHLQGSPTRMCRSSGWSGSAPTCARDCGGLTAPSNGHVEFHGTTEGSMATYGCSSAYNLQGSGTRMCLSTGIWSSTAPTCSIDSAFIIGGSVAGVVILGIIILSIGIAVACVCTKKKKTNGGVQEYDNIPPPLYRDTGYCSDHEKPPMDLEKETKAM